MAGGIPIDGSVLRELREDRLWTQKDLADRARRFALERGDRHCGLGRETVTKYETSTNRRPSIRQALQALTQETNANRRDTLQFGLAAGGHLLLSSSGGQPGTALSPMDTVQAVRTALLRYPDLAPARGRERGEATSLSTLREQVNRGWRTYQAARYACLGVLLPTLLDTAQLTARESEGDDQLAAWGLLADAYQLAAVALLKVGAVSVAWLAADRGVLAAERSKDPLVLGAAVRILTYVLLESGDHQGARELAVSAAGALEPKLTTSLEGRSVHGALFLKAAVATARDGDQPGARDLLAEARRTASCLPGDRNYQWTAFGPTNVALHAVSVAVELHDPGDALARANRIDSARLPVVERRARLLVDIARAQSQWRRDAEALENLLQAEALAADEVRWEPTVTALVSDLLGRAPSVSPQLRGLAHRVGVAAGGMR